MSNQIINPENALAMVTNPEYTGQANTSSSFPPIINILQSTQQHKVFTGVEDLQSKLDDEAINPDEEAEVQEELSKLLGKISSRYGYLFVREDGLVSPESLKKVLTGFIPLKIEQGHEVLQVEGDKKKIVESYPHMIKKTDKESWLRQHPGHEYRNMVKVIGTFYDTQTIEEMLEAGSNPFCILAIKGSGWPAWFDAQKDMDGLSMSSSIYGHKKSKDMAVSCFRFDISSTKETGAQSVYYAPSIKVTLNDPTTAAAYMKYVMSLKEGSLFDRVAEKIAERDGVIESEALPADLLD